MFQRETLVENQLLHTEYQEVNQEFRHRNQLLHNTFYLLIIASGVFLGLLIQFGIGQDRIVLGGLTIASGIVASIIGHLFLKHFHERSSAEVVRMHAEWVANGQRTNVKRALSLEWGVAGGGAKYDEENDRIIRRGSHVHYLNKFPDSFLSAEFFGLILIYLGTIGLVIGATWVGNVFTSGRIPLAIGGVSSVLIFTLYWVARRRSRPPGDEPIY